MRKDERKRKVDRVVKLLNRERIYEQTERWVVVVIGIIVVVILLLAIYKL